MWKALPRDSVTHATVGEAVEAFRDDGTAGRSPRLSGEYPPPGVYSYATRGGERFDGGLWEATHGYDGVSTVTLRTAGCGLVERWQVLVERWSEARTCVGPSGSSLASVRDHHEFFGDSRANSYRCTGAPVQPAAELRPGQRWRSSCSGEGGTITTVSQVLGVSGIEAAQRRISAVHVRSRTVFSGESKGVSVRQEWWRQADGLLLRRELRVRADVSGGGRYSESATLRLLALRPRR
ncbi:MAG: hypothetical protein ACTHLH_03965 [Solirubrobacterales bacterium]